MRTILGAGEVGMAVVIHGREIPEYPHQGDTYVMARHGTEYGLQFWNFTNSRIEVVCTVDGLNILTGKVGDWQTQRGYVVDAHSKPQVIPGFRLDERAAAQFRFGGVDASYAARMGQPTNVGVIGAAIFRERERFPTLAFYSRTLGGGSDTFGATKGGNFESRGAMRGAPDMGTEFGRKVDFRTGNTTFERKSSHPDALLTLQYRSEATLRDLGIDIRRPPVSVAEQPNPFPGSTGCVPPEGWDPRHGTTHPRR